MKLMRLGQMFADPNKARKDLETFASVNDARLYKLVKGCVDPQSDLRQIVKAKVRLLLRAASSISASLASS